MPSVDSTGGPSPRLLLGLEQPAVSTVPGGRRHDSTPSPSPVIRVGTWNASGWSVDRAAVVVDELRTDVLAIQETHLAPYPLEAARSAAMRRGLCLHHGRAVQPTPGCTFARRCGVGFLTSPGVAVSPAPPRGAAWRMLHAIYRLHAVQIPPREGLPHGLLLLSIYAPVADRSQQVERDRFNLAMLQLTHELDLQIPTLLMGDFNGSANPSRDYKGVTGHRRPHCPLLPQLLGPGGAWLDVQATLCEAPLCWTYRNTDTTGVESASRIDLVLANQAALTLIGSITVISTVCSGGHSPVVVTLHSRPVALQWQRPRPRLPPIMYLSSAELQCSTTWASVLQRWAASAPGSAAMDPQRPHCVDSLSAALWHALHHLVDLAGGWITRPKHRRLAYDSQAARLLRRQLGSLRQLTSMVESAVSLPTVGCWPHSWLRLIHALQSLDVQLPHNSQHSLLAVCRMEAKGRQQQLDVLMQRMRRERHQRWKEHLPSLWQERPGVIYSWLHAVGAPWGTTPILDDTGLQCTTPSAVDEAVRGYWVNMVLRQHAQVDGSAKWTAFVNSRFGPHIPVAEWPHLPWDGSRVRRGLQQMRESASPGALGIPISVWRTLPDTWMTAVARLLNLVEATGRWPPEWLQAYVTMIPKATGGTRPRDQRPITVLEVIYRVWSKGVVLEWAPVLHSYLGPAAMGFRSGTGTLHLAQILSDLIAVRKRQRRPLWLASFDIEKCFDSLPWWALFGVLRHAGVQSSVVGAFEAFYRDLQRRFRYGQVEGEPWQAANGIAQGCPASPDLLNMLFEAFHRWARAAGFGVQVDSVRIPSVSFADDLALVAGSQSAMQELIAAYLEWCGLLGVKVTKVQVWCNEGAGLAIGVGDSSVETVSTFKIVGVVLGSHEVQATQVHLAPRMEKATATARRLQQLPLPASLIALLWRTAVLPQALYGCEIRNVCPKQLVGLSSLGRTSLASKPPLALNSWRAPLPLTGPPLGECALRDPALEMLDRRLCWLQLLANLPGLAGLVHRAVTWCSGRWQEPSAALRAALQFSGWRVQRNPACIRALSWPVIDPEMSFPGTVIFQPEDSFPLLDAVFTDGSLTAVGGAAAVQPDTETTLQASVPAARSSTHCELAALCLAMTLQPSQVLTDSLCAMQLLHRWGSTPTARTLRCTDRMEVRQVIHAASLLAKAPVLEKVKAHDTGAIALGVPKAVGNDMADQAAAAAASASTLWSVARGLHGDAVELLDASGAWVADVRAAVSSTWWRNRCSGKPLRPPLDLLYPVGLAIDWKLSCGIFRRVHVADGRFITTTPSPVIKWLARVRTGCLACRARLHRHGLEDSPACPCCAAEVEDDLHVLTGCSATGSSEWAAGWAETWAETAHQLGISVTAPSAEWVAAHLLPVQAALIPVSLRSLLPGARADRFLAHLHRSLAARTAEILRRREALIATLPPAAPLQPLDRGTLAASTPPPLCTLPLERQLSVADLRQMEMQRRQSVATAPPPASSSPVPPPGAPSHGPARATWLRSRLVRVLQEDMQVCPPSTGSGALEILELFERLAHEPFTASPGALLKMRTASVGKTLGNIFSQVPINPPLERCSLNGVIRYNRCPTVAADITAWRRRVETEEAFRPPAPKPRELMAQDDAGLARWIQSHSYLQPVDVSEGESGMALLILWEVDHGRPYPRNGGDTQAAVLAGFSRRLKSRVQGNSELREWLTTRYMQQPLAPGLPLSHHARWSVRVVRPPPHHPQGWYEEFVQRWRAFLEAQQTPRASLATTSTQDMPSSSSNVEATGPAAVNCRPREETPETSRLAAPAKRRRQQPANRPEDLTCIADTACRPECSAPSRVRQRQREEAQAASLEASAPRTSRQRTLASWVRHSDQVAPTPPCRHGRATEGPPT